MSNAYCLKSTVHGLESVEYLTGAAEAASLLEVSEVVQIWNCFSLSPETWYDSILREITSVEGCIEIKDF